MMPSMLNKRSGEPGIPLIRTEKDWLHLSLKTFVYRQQDFILKGGRKVSLRPELMRVR